MAFFETITMTLGMATARALVKALFGGDALGDFAADMLDPAQSQFEAFLDARRGSRQSEALGQAIARQLERSFRDEARALADNDRRAVAFALARAVARVDAARLAASKLDPQRLAATLRAESGAETRDFSANATALYTRLLDEASVLLVNTAGSFDGLPEHVFAALLQQDAQIQQVLEALVARPAADDEAMARMHRNEILQRYDKLDQFGVPRVDDDHIAGWQKLSAVFIAPLLKEQRAERDDDARLPALLAGSRESLAREALPRSSEPATQLLQRTRRLLIRGEAGSGKSTLLKWLAVTAAQAQQLAPEGGLHEWQRSVPFFVRLRDWSNCDLPDLAELASALDEHFDQAQVKRWVRRLLEEGRALLLVDGVDELPRSKRATLLQWLDRMLSNYPLVRVVISSRPPALKAEAWPEWQDWMGRNAVTESTLEALEPSQIEALIEQWHAAARAVALREEQDDLASLAGRLKLLLQQRRPLYRLASNPLLCAMICALHRSSRQTLPDARLELYDECVRMLLHRRDTIRNIGTGDYALASLGYERKLDMAQKFARWFMEEDDSSVERAQADQKFSAILRDGNLHEQYSGAQAREFFVDRSGLLNDDGRIAFAHRTFQEYLAAGELVKQMACSTLVHKTRDTQWHETIILASGLAGQNNPKEREKLLTRLLKKAQSFKKAESKRQALLLALACLENEVGLNPATRARVLAAAAPLFPPQDDEEATILAHGGEPAVELLLPRAEYDDKTAVACISALAAIGGARALAAIEAYACLERDDWGYWVRRALGAAWTSFEPHEYARRVLQRQPRLALPALPADLSLIAHVRTLTLEAANNDDLTRLASLAQLTSLTLIGNQISDLRPLASLAQLTSLTLSGNQISDFTPLTNLTQLTSLYLGSTQVTDLAPLAGLTQLTSLTLSGTQVSDLHPLASLTQLTSLTLSFTPVSDLRPLTSLTQLTSLDLSFTSVSDLHPLAGLAQLTSLSLIGTQVSDLSSLASLTQLTSLTLIGTQVSDLRPLTNLAQLTSLDISGTQVSDLSSLASLTQLTSLDLSFTSVSDLHPLAGLAQLTELALSSAHISDLSPLASLVQLTSLDLSFTPVSDLTSLASLAQLTFLVLFDTQVSDLSPLASLTRLTKLSLRGTPISDLTPILHLKGLRVITDKGVVVMGVDD